jgi:hypothetical protein
MLIRRIVAGTADKNISGFPEILQPLGQGTVTHTKIFGTSSNTEFLVILIILDSIQFKLLVMLL